MVWNYFNINRNDKDVYAQCKVIDNDEIECGIKILHTGSTGNLIKHLARKHTLTKDSSIKNKVIFHIMIYFYNCNLIS